MALHTDSNFPLLFERRLSTHSHTACQQTSESHQFSDDLWAAILQKEIVLTESPPYSWKLVLDNNNLPEFEDYYTISRHLCSDIKKADHTCPYGDEPAPIACITKTAEPREVRDAYTLSALRFRLSPFKNQKSTEENKCSGLPTDLRSLYAVKVRQDEASLSKLRSFIDLQKSTLSEVKESVSDSQQRMRAQYVSELVPLMNANPFNPGLHDRELSPEMMYDLAAYVDMQNRPCRFFDLMQWLERDVTLNTWRAAKTDAFLLVLKGKLLQALPGNFLPVKKDLKTARSTDELLSILMSSHQSSEFALIEEIIGKVFGEVTRWLIALTMSGWQDYDGHRRKKAIICPTGVPLGYMQSLRRKDQPYITQEFSNHAHGGLNHWLQEHIWQRFCKRYPDKHQLHPSDFLKQLGNIHSHICIQSEGKVREVNANLHMFADAIYELHMPNLANPANTNFWTVLQLYLPWMSPWP